MKRIPMLDLKLEYEYMKDEIDAAIRKCLEHQSWILGPEVKELEEKIANYLGVKYCIGVSSGTDALVLSLRALAIKLKNKEFFDKEDEIITTPFTFVATGDAILRSGATPVFVDIDPKTYNIDAEKIEEYIKENNSKNIVGIIPVHLYGLSCNMDKIVDIAKKYNLFIVEDVAQAFGGMWREKKLGSIGTVGCFSFFPSKNLGGYGDGGMVATNDEELAELVRMLLKHGGKDKYNVDHIGYNARLDTLQAAILLVKLKYVDEFNEKRRRIAKIYDENLKGLPDIIRPLNLKESLPAYNVYHQYTLRVTNGKRELLRNYLKGKNIETMVYYPLPLHKMKVFDGRCEIFRELKNSELICGEVLSLPLEPLMKEEEILFVSKAIKDFFNINNK